MKRPPNSEKSRPACDARIDWLLVLLSLTGFTIAAPVLTIFGENPGLFSFQNVDSLSLLILYALLVAFLPPLTLWVISVIAGLVGKSIGVAVHVATVGLLSGLWLIQLAKWSFGIEQPWIISILAISGGAGFVFAYLRWPFVNGLLKISAVAPLVAVGTFLLLSDTGSLADKVDVEIALTEPEENLPSILFVMLDEFPTMGLLDEEGSLDKERFPNLVELMKQATWYRHYSVLADSTHLSVPSILTGNEPRPKVPRMANYPNNLFSLLAPTHHLTVFELVSGLCELPQCGEGSLRDPITKPDPRMGALLSQTASLWLQRVSPEDRGGARLGDFEERLTAARQDTQECSERQETPTTSSPSCNSELEVHKLDRVREFVGTLVGDQRSVLYYLHIAMPHIPWRFYGDGQLYRTPYSDFHISPLDNNTNEWLARISEFRFLMQAQYTDQLLGDVFTRLKKLGVWDDIAVVITADHGRSFLINTPPRAFGPQTLDSVAYAPLFIKRPHQKRGQVDDSNVMAIDLLPTIADILGIDLPWPVAGLSAGHPGIVERGDQKIYYPRKDIASFGMQLVGERSFSDLEQFPDYSSRQIGALKRDEDPLVELNKVLGLENFIGRSPLEFETVPGGSVTVVHLASLLAPAADEVMAGVVTGHLEFPPGEAEKVLVSVNGQFVSGSPLVKIYNVENSFVAMLPSNVLKSQNDIGVYLVKESGLIELEIH